MKPLEILEIMQGVQIKMTPFVKSGFAEIDRKFAEHKLVTKVVKNPWFKGGKFDVKQVPDKKKA